MSGKDDDDQKPVAPKREEDPAAAGPSNKRSRAAVEQDDMPANERDSARLIGPYGDFDEANLSCCICTDLLYNPISRKFADK